VVQECRALVHLPTGEVSILTQSLHKQCIWEHWVAGGGLHPQRHCTLEAPSWH